MQPLRVNKKAITHVIVTLCWHPTNPISFSLSLSSPLSPRGYHHPDLYRDHAFLLCNFAIHVPILKQFSFAWFWIFINRTLLRMPFRNMCLHIEINAYTYKWQYAILVQLSILWNYHSIFLLSVINSLWSNLQFATINTHVAMIVHFVLPRSRPAKS